MEKIAEESGRSIEQTDPSTLDLFWEKAKKMTK
jgi:hypothetical protein